MLYKCPLYFKDEHLLAILPQDMQDQINIPQWLLLSGAVSVSAPLNKIYLHWKESNTIELRFCFCFGRYHILVGDFFFSFSEACDLTLILSDLEVTTRNINECLCMLQKHLLNAEEWLSQLMMAVFSQYCESSTV